MAVITRWSYKRGGRKAGFHCTCDIGNFRGHICCPQATQELPKKHCEAEPPERLPTDALSQIDYGHTRPAGKIARSISENLSSGMHMAE